MVHFHLSTFNVCTECLPSVYWGRPSLCQNRCVFVCVDLELVTEALLSFSLFTMFATPGL